MPHVCFSLTREFHLYPEKFGEQLTGHLEEYERRKVAEKPVQDRRKRAVLTTNYVNPHILGTMIMHYTIITESHEKGGFTARCVEIPGAAGYGSTQGEALARIREAIEVVREAQNAELHKTIAAVHSEIIKIEVADSA